LKHDIFIDVNSLDTFDNEQLFLNEDHIRYKEKGIQFSNIDFGNSTFRLDSYFIYKCRDKVQENVFLEDDHPFDSTEKPYERIQVVFKNCKFCNFITKEQIIKDDILFDYDEVSDNLRINKFIVFGSNFEGKFYINKQYSGNDKQLKINSVKVYDSVFQENFKLHNSKINIVSIEDSDFEKHADFFKSIFINGTLEENKKESISLNDIGFKAVNFKGLALFGDTEFYKKLIFKYVTFESFSHFRKAKLFQGLDLDYSNIQNEMNFFDVQKLDTKEAKRNTSQETYRIIKHNFEKIGNKIEANKYFAFELEQKKINMSSKWTDYIVFQINWLSSEFGTNWLRVLGLICCIGVMTVGFIHFELLKQLFFNPSLFKLEYVMKAFNEFFQYLYILNKSETLTSHPAILLFNKITLGYLYYQFLISIRKDTRK